MSNRCFSGLHMATVTKVGSDREGLNRVESKLVSEGAKGIKLDLAPVLTNSAGKNYGIVSLPKKGDFVIVAFLDNDIQRPVILGSIPTPTRKPPIKAKSKNSIRAHKTAGGMEITIDESETKPKITVKTKRGNKIVLEDSSSKQSLNVKSKDGKTSLSIDLKSSTIKLKAQTIKLSANKEASIKAGGSSVKISNSGIKLKSSGGKFSAQANNIDLKANATAKISANAQVNIKGTAGANLKSSALTQVGGSLVKIG